MAEVFVTPTGALTRRSITDLRKAGVVVVETDDYAHHAFVRSSEMVSADDMLWAAMQALGHEGDTYNKGHHQREQLARLLIQITDRRWRSLLGPVDSAAGTVPE